MVGKCLGGGGKGKYSKAEKSNGSSFSSFIRLAQINFSSLIRLVQIFMELQTE